MKRTAAVPTEHLNVGRVLAEQIAEQEGAALVAVAGRAAERLTSVKAGQPRLLIPAKKLLAPPLQLKKADLARQRTLQLTLPPATALDTLLVLLQAECRKAGLEVQQWSLGPKGLSVVCGVAAKELGGARSRVFRKLAQDCFGAELPRLPSRNEARWALLRKGESLFYRAAMRQYWNYLEWCEAAPRDPLAASPEQHEEYRAHLRAQPGMKHDPAKNKYLTYVFSFVLQCGPPSKLDLAQRLQARPTG